MFLAGYTFGWLSTPGNGSSDAVLPIVQCHSTLACAGGETSFQCFQGYADTRCAHKASSQPAVWLTRHRLAPSAREPLQSSLLRGFGCRCGACDVGYYGLSSGECRECGNRILVLFLSHAVPALTILGTTLFLFWGGKVDPQKANRSAAATSPASMVRHIVVWVSCSSCGKPTSCLGPISGHGELLVRVPCFVES
jgi:hypothetical protein